jgi:hypothetical protein
MPDGNSLRVARLIIDDSGKHGRLELRTTADFDGVQAAVARMSRHGDEALSYGPMRPDALMNALFNRLGLNVPALADTTESMPPATLDEPLNATIDGLAGTLKSARGLGLLRRHCGACHSAATSFPPGFLSGNEDQQRGHVAICAPRMLRRLSMWKLDSAARSKSPMPPAHMLSAFGHDAQLWLESESYSSIAAYLDTLTQELREEPKEYSELD